jgi:hypothetical protein
MFRLPLPAPEETARPMRPVVRGTLVGVAVGLVAVFVTARRLDPYFPDGTPRRVGTHQQLGLPPCTFRVATGLPCPSCGMTTSFAFLMHGDVGQSLRANAVGTLLAVFGLGLIPWCLASAWRRRPLFVRSVERTVTTFVLVLLGLLLVRWTVMLLVWWSAGATPQG